MADPHRITELLFVAIALFVFGCSRPKNLVGVWQTEKVLFRATGNPNKAIEGYETAEFMADGSFKITTTMLAFNGESTTMLAYAGTYSILGANHVRLNTATISNKSEFAQPITVEFSIAGDELTLPALDPGAVPERKKYKRMKNSP